MLESRSVENQKVFVNRDGSACIVCPNCGASKTIDFSRLETRADRFRVRCYCRSVFCVSCERRRSDRKETYFEGHYVTLSEQNDWNKIVVKDLSHLGVGFTTVSSHKLKAGEDIRITLTTVDASFPDVRKDATVRFVSQGQLGCEFDRPLQIEEAMMLGIMV